MTKAEKAERDQAIADLRDMLKPGDTVYTVLDHVSRSGMARAIRVLVPAKNADGSIAMYGSEIAFLHPNYKVGLALGLRHWRRNGREQDALLVGGCGMDMGFHLVYELASVLYGRRTCSGCHQAIPVDYPAGVTCGDCDGAIVGGYACLGPGKCPSNYHVNHRDRVRCPGVSSSPEDWRHCYKPSPFGRYEVPADWPRGPERTITTEEDGGASITVPGPLLACVQTPNADGTDGSGAYVVCPTCQGAGDVPNPDGPERWDLVHTDGYALRHKWL